MQAGPSGVPKRSTRPGVAAGRRAQGPGSQRLTGEGDRGHRCAGPVTHREVEAAAPVMLTTIPAWAHSLSVGAAGAVRGGDRLPWVETGPGARQLRPARLAGVAGPRLRGTAGRPGRGLRRAAAPPPRFSLAAGHA